MLLDHIRKLPHGRANLKQLLRELGSRGSTRPQIEAELARLVKRGDLIETRPDHYVALGSTREFTAGRLSSIERGPEPVVQPKPAKSKPKKKPAAT